METQDLTITISGVKALGDDKALARALQQDPQWYVYTQVAQGKSNGLAYGILGCDNVAYYALPVYVGEYVKLPDDEPYPFGEFEEADATEIAMLAMRFLRGEYWQEITRDVGTTHRKRLLGLLERALAQNAAGEGCPDPNILSPRRCIPSRRRPSDKENS